LVISKGGEALGVISALGSNDGESVKRSTRARAWALERAEIDGGVDWNPSWAVMRDRDDAKSGLGMAGQGGGLEAGA
jgi:hypothetical protein